jgi:NitT/TauT family transport system substrate-binding protein
MKKLLILLSAVLIVGCVPIRLPVQEATTKTPITICYSAALASNAVFIYALENGIYGEHGLDVNLVYIEGGSAATSALIAGEADICQVAGSAVVNGVVAGADIVLVGGLINTYTFSLLVAPEITTSADLQGKVLGVSDFGASSDTALRILLNSFNLRPDQDVTILAIGGQSERLAAMASGAIDGTLISIPQTVRARALGYRELVNMAQLNTPYQHTALATSRQFLDEHPDTARRFLEATIDSIAQMKADKAGVIDVLAQHLLLDAEEDQAELEEAYNVLILQYIPDIPYPTSEGVQVLLDVLVAENPAAANYTPDDVIDTTLLNEITQAAQEESP